MGNKVLIFGYNELSFPIRKIRYIYEAILIECGSVKITHTCEKYGQKNSPISYSKLIIKMVIPIQKWIIHPQKSKSLSICIENKISTIQYNYWDYIKAWTHAFTTKIREGNTHGFSNYVRIRLDKMIFRIGSLFGSPNLNQERTIFHL